MIKRTGRIILAVVGILVILFGVERTMPKGQDVSTDNLTITKIDAKGHVEKFHDLDISLTNKGDIVKILIKMPKKDMVKDSSLCFYVYHSCVDVTFEGKSLFSFGKDYVKKNYMIGSVYPKVQIPDDAWGKSLEVTLKVTEDGAFSSINRMSIYKSGQANMYSINRDFFAFIISLSGLVLGVVIILAMLVFRNKDSLSYQGVATGVMIIILSLWMLCYYGQYNVFTDINHNFFWQQIENFTLYVGTLPIVVYIYQSATKTSEKRMLLSLMIIQSTFVAISTILNYTGIIHYCRLLTASHVLNFVSIVALVYVLYHRIGRDDGTQNYILYGFTCLAIFGLVDILRYNTFIYFNNPLISSDTSVLPVGLKIFVILLIISFFEDVKNSTAQIEAKNYLESVAYFDSVTNLYNRSKIDEILERIKTDNDKDYILVMFDLNGLKETNDAKGHIKGDELLINFGKLLNEQFDRLGVVGRIGGDEFLLVVSNRSIDQISVALGKLWEATKDYNKHHDTPLSFAYGVSVSDEKEPKEVDEALKEADKALYVLKKQQKRIYD